jgi:hypothetical protein
MLRLLQDLRTIAVTQNFWRSHNERPNLKDKHELL